jgi:hypothetical protein
LQEPRPPENKAEVQELLQVLPAKTSRAQEHNWATKEEQAPISVTTESQALSPKSLSEKPVETQKPVEFSPLSPSKSSEIYEKGISLEVQPTEEPKTEEPVKEEPVVQEKQKSEESTEKKKIEGPAEEKKPEDIVEEPKTEERVKEEPVVQEKQKSEESTEKKKIEEPTEEKKPEEPVKAQEITTEQARKIFDDIKKGQLPKLCEELKSKMVEAKDPPEVKAEVQKSITEFEKNLSGQLSAVEKSSYITPEEKKKFASDVNEMMNDMQKLSDKPEALDRLTNEIEGDPDSTKYKPYDPEIRRAKIEKGAKLIQSLAGKPKEFHGSLADLTVDESKYGKIDGVKTKADLITKLLKDPSKLTDAQVRQMYKDTDIIDYRKEYCKNIESIGESLVYFAKASKKPTDFISGTFVIQDTNGALHEYLKNYAEIEYKLKNGPQADINKPCHLAHGKAYPRVSSHFSNWFKGGTTKSKPINYGIDLDEHIKVADTGEDRDSRSHFLFGKLDSTETYMYIKFETHGLGSPLEAAKHAKNWVRRTVAKAWESVQAKSDIKKQQEPPKSKNQTKKSEKSGNKDTFDIRDVRENTPKIISETYKKLLEADTNLNKKVRKNLLEQVKARGISAILKSINAKFTENQDFKDFKDKIIRTYKKEFGEDKAITYERNGNELRVTPKDLANMQFKSLEQK